MRNSTILFVIVASLAVAACESAVSKTSLPGQHPRALRKSITVNLSGQYLLFLPQDYGEGEKRYPLIMYLHGGSLRGNDIERVRSLGLPQLIEKDRSFPFIVVSPQCPEGEIWTDADLLIAILDDVVSQYAVDRERIYLTGHSMGGRGAWYLASKHPDRFAAIAPMSGGPTIAAWAGRLKEMAVWAFHGAKDDLIPLAESQRMVDALKAAGNNEVKFTILPDRDHYILDTYEKKELYDWFLQHRRVQK
jgi:predicted peptidase